MISFEAALAYANRVYLAHRAEFDPVILPPQPPTKHFNQWPGKVFNEPRLKWTEHRGKIVNSNQAKSTASPL